MGFFSWKTSDTGRSIANIYSGTRRPFKVYMITEDGQIFTEEAYLGYGEFGGKDFYELVAELNGKTTREEGIDICFKDNPSGEYNGTFKMPKLVENLPTEKNFMTVWNALPYPESCEYQGYFYKPWDEDNEW